MQWTLLNASVFVLLLLAHYFPVNHAEKEWWAYYSPLPKSMLVRPLAECADATAAAGCRGMPSGHAETAAIFAWVLFQYRQISAFTAFAIIVAMCIQRVMFHRHTISQVIAGSVLGITYGTIYRKTNLSVFSLLIPVLLIVCLRGFSTVAGLTQTEPNKDYLDNESQ